MALLEEAASDDLAILGLVEFLAADVRPSCVVDLLADGGQVARICFTNAKFKADYDLDDLAHHSHGTADSEDVYFRNWVLSRAAQGSHATLNCFGLGWHATMLRRRWKIIQATTPTRFQPDTDDSDSDSHHDLKHAGVSRTLPKGSSEAHHDWLKVLMDTASGHDWTAARAPKGMPDHVRFLRSWDWGKTPLGPKEKWSPRLKLMANLIAVDPNPAVMFWGPELIGIYNEPYVPLLHDKHPKSLGEPYHKTWSELYRQEAVATMLDDLWQKMVQGKPVVWLNQPFYLRNGSRLQEHLFHLSFLPILDEDGKTVAFYESIKEVTSDHLNARRSKSIRGIGELTAGEENLNKFFQKIMSALEPNENDFPFAMLYSLESANIDWNRPFRLDHALHGGLATLESSFGVRLTDGIPDVHKVLVQNQDFLDAFQAVCSSGQIETFDLEPRPCIPSSIMEEKPKRAFGDQTRLSILVPIEPIAQKGVNAVLFIGVNPRRPYDVDYEVFIRGLARSISSSLASLILMHEQKRITGEALEMEKRAMSMLESSPVGSALLDIEGRVLYANKSWHSISGYPHDAFWPFSWMDIMADDYVEVCRQEWPNVVEHNMRRTFEVALRKPWTYVDPATHEVVTDRTYVLISAFVQRIGETDYITSAVTDISYQKWIEALQRKRRQEALDMKRQQENFMDMTSHEMRNPLSAIFQCADAIVSSLSAFQRNGYGFTPDLSATSSTGRRNNVDPKVTRDEAIAHAIENAGTITLCAQHQKRIVDDVLVLSKVDANLIEIHPVDVQPKVLIENAIKMFAAELAANNAKMSLEIEPSFQKLGVDWVKLDPGRVLQILINLCTNAIKFSMDSTNREISIAVGASTDVPRHSSRGVRYLSDVTEEGFTDPTSRSEWGSGEVLYLSFEVSDTGRGMTAEEMKSLFQRFTQASPRTHTQYGGSGLGLFIARLLSRLQGGEIGVVSKTGEGSTFAFHIKVRRAETPHGLDVHTVVPQVNIPVAMQDPESPSVMADVAEREPSRTSEISILIVEDNVVNQRVLARQLRSEGFEVTIANHGAEAIEIIKRTVFWRENMLSGGLKLNIVLMDIEMPVMNGTEATRRIREYEQQGMLTDHVPIIAITANARSEQIAVARNAGMDEVVSKPFRIPELLAKMESFVGPLITNH